MYIDRWSETEVYKSRLSLPGKEENSLLSALNSLLPLLLCSNAGLLLYGKPKPTERPFNRLKPEPNGTNLSHGSLGPPFITQGVTTGTAVHSSGDAAHAGHAPQTLFRASGKPNCRLTCMAATPSRWHCMPAPSTGETPILQAVAATSSFGRDTSSPGRESTSLMTYPSPGCGLPGS